MKKQLNFVLFLTLGAGTLATTAVAQNVKPVEDRDNARLEYATFDPSESNAVLQQVDWDDHHRCDGDHDRDDRNCYRRDRDDYYRGNAYYGNGNYARGYAPPVYIRPNGWYDRNGYWHAYDRDRDRDRRRHDDDDRR
jgi:hypothetical protein